MSSITILFGQVSSGLTLNAGDRATVSAGGTAIATTVNAGAFATISSGGVGDSSVIAANGIQEVLSGGTATAATVDDQGEQYVGSAGFASGSVVAGGGVETVAEGGTVAGGAIAAGGFEAVAGVADAMTVASGGILSVGEGGTASAAGVLSGGNLGVASGGTSIAPSVSGGGFLIVSSGATAIAPSLAAGAIVAVLAGGAVIGADTAAGGSVIPAGAFLMTSGRLIAGATTMRASGFDVSAGQAEVILPGGTIAATIVDGGAAEILPGGTGVGTTLTDATEFVASRGAALGTVIGSGGVEVIVPGGIAVGATVAAGGTNFVFSAASALDATVRADGFQQISSGGFASATTVASGGFQLVQSGGTATASTIASGGIQLVLPGAIVTGTAAAPGAAIVSTGVLVTISAHPTEIDAVSASNLVLGGADGPDDASVYVLPGGTALAATIGAGGAMAVTAGGVAIATSLSTGGGLLVFSGGIATGVALAEGSTLIAQPGATVSDAEVGSGADLVIQTGASTGETGLALGGTIDLPGLAFVSANLGQLDPTTDRLTISKGTLTSTLQLSGGYGGVFFQTASDGAIGTEVIAATSPCFLTGTFIRTPDGERPVEALRPGDAVVCWSGQQRRVTWVGIGRQAITDANRTTAAPVIFKGGSLADGVPDWDLRVTPEHAMLVDGLLVPAHALVNGRSIRRDGDAARIRYHHVELDSHDILVANGAPAESYRNDDNRQHFLIGIGVPVARAAPPCRPTVSAGAEAARRWRALSARAGVGPPIVRSPELHLLADGCPTPLVPVGEIWQAILPRWPERLRLRARSAVPAELGIAFDHRRLGVAVRWIAFSRGGWRCELPADSDVLADGFHAIEAGCRWMNGDARIAVETLAPHRGPILVTLALDGIAFVTAKARALPWTRQDAARPGPAFLSGGLVHVPLSGAHR